MLTTCLWSSSKKKKKEKTNWRKGLRWPLHSIDSPSSSAPMLLLDSGSIPPSLAVLLWCFHLSQISQLNSTIPRHSVSVLLVFDGSTRPCHPLPLCFSAPLRSQTQSHHLSDTLTRKKRTRETKRRLMWWHGVTWERWGLWRGEEVEGELEVYVDKGDPCASTCGAQYACVPSTRSMHSPPLPCHGLRWTARSIALLCSL